MSVYPEYHESYHVSSYLYGFNTTERNISANSSSPPPVLQRHINILAVIIITSIMMVGACGNGLLFFVIRKKMTQSPFNFLLGVLAMLDFVACITQIPIDLITLLNPVYQSTLFTCQVTGVLGAHTVASSATILSFVAYFRYSVVCNPHTSTFNTADAKKVSILALISPVVFVWAAMFLYDTRVLVVDDNNYFYSDCGISRGMESTVYPQIFYGLFLIIFFISLTTMSVCYVRVAKALQRRTKIGSVGFLKGERIHIVLVNIAPIVPVGQVPHPPPNLSGQAGKTRKAFVLMVCVTVLFCVSFIPHSALIITYLTSQHSDFRMLIGSMMAYSMIFRSYFLSNFLNPILYGFFHREFLTELKQTFKRVPCFKC